MHRVYQTELGTYFHGNCEQLLQSSLTKDYRGQVDLIFTSPPFILNNPKKYGNFQGQEYIDWFANFAPVFRSMLKPSGSIVIELGNAWEPGRPVMSTLPIKALLEFLDRGDFVLCQQFIWNNPARLPSPVQWVNIERIRVKDAFTHLWWMSAIDRPKASNRNVLKEYSAGMKKLLHTQKYNPGKRPSEHNIGQTSFLTDNSGAIPSNVLSISNTLSSHQYSSYCRSHGLPVHPARMPTEVADFFIKFLTEENDLVLDTFAGSNTTGAAAESLHRRWISVDTNDAYIQGSKGRFSIFGTERQSSSQLETVLP